MFIKIHTLEARKNNLKWFFLGIVKKILVVVVTPTRITDKKKLPSPANTIQTHAHTIQNEININFI